MLFCGPCVWWCHTNITKHKKNSLVVYKWTKPPANHMQICSKSLSHKWAQSRLCENWAHARALLSKRLCNLNAHKSNYCLFTYIRWDHSHCVHRLFILIGCCLLNLETQKSHHTVYSYSETISWQIFTFRFFQNYAYINRGRVQNKPEGPSCRLHWFPVS